MLMKLAVDGCGEEHSGACRGELGETVCSSGAAGNFDSNFQLFCTGSLCEAQYRFGLELVNMWRNLFHSISTSSFLFLKMNEISSSVIGCKNEW